MFSGGFGVDTAGKFSGTGKALSGKGALGGAKGVMSLGSLVPGIGTAFAIGSMAFDIAGMFMDDGSGERGLPERNGSVPNGSQEPSA